MADRAEDLPQFEGKPTIRLDQQMPEKGSIIALSDSAFRLLVECICHCGEKQTNGRVPVAVVTRMATKKTAPAELVKRGHMVRLDSETWYLPDYLRWNRSSSEIGLMREAKSQSGALGAHNRWHVPNRKRQKGCELCYPEGESNE